MISLQRGPLSFTARSLGDGPLVLCLHGFPDNANSWREQLPVLADAGFCAVAVTMRGYEPTSQPPDHNYSLPAIAQDVISFVDQLGEQQAHLIGHDWGAAATYTAGALAPGRFKSLTTIAVPHSGRFVNEAIKYPKQLRLSWYMFFFQLRGIAEHVVQRNDFQMIRNLWSAWSPGWDVPDAVLEDVLTNFRQPGVVKAALAYYRAVLRPGAFMPAARAAARFKVRVPTLAITGADDGCIDSGVFRKMMLEDDFPSGLEVHQVANAGHFPHQEQPQSVNQLILPWVKHWENDQH